MPTSTLAPRTDPIAARRLFIAGCIALGTGVAACLPLLTSAPLSAATPTPCHNNVTAMHLVSSDGFAKGAMPQEYTGGLGRAGADALREFATQGGTLVFLNRSTAYASEYLGVKAKNLLEVVSTRDYYAPGSLLNVTLAAGNPLTLGLPNEIAIWCELSPAWKLDAAAVARYPESQILASGWLLGEKLLAGRAALVNATLGHGHVILFGMRPQYRGQSYQTFKLFFNALVYP